MKEQILREALRKEIRKQLHEGKLINLLVKLFFSGKIKKAANSVLNDPDVQDATRSVEYAVEQWEQAIKREEENRNRPEWKAAVARAEEKRRQRLAKK